MPGSEQLCIEKLCFSPYLIEMIWEIYKPNKLVLILFQEKAKSNK